MGGLSKIPHWIWYVAGAGAALVIIILVSLRSRAAAPPSTGTTTLVPSGTATGSNTAADSSNAISALEAAMQQQNAAYEGILQTLTNTGAGATGGANSPSNPAPTLNTTLIKGPRQGELAGQVGPPIYTSTAQYTGDYLPWGSQVDVTGAVPGQPNLFSILGPGGTTEYISGLDIGSWIPQAPAAAASSSGVPISGNVPSAPGV